MVIPARSTEDFGIIYDLGAASDLSVGASTYVASVDTWAVRGQGSGHDLLIEGTASGYDSSVLGGGGIFLGGHEGQTNNRVIVGQYGSVMANVSEGQSAAIVMATVTGQIVNHGVIEARGVIPGSEVGYGLALSVGTGGLSVLNSGEINGGLGGVRHFALTSGAASKLTLVNTGYLRGGAFAYIDDNTDAQPGAIASVDVVVNRGLISGNVLLGLGNDVYDGRGGRLVGFSDFVAGGAGDDYFRPGAWRDVFIGGADVDTLDFSAGGAVTLALDGSVLSGGAAAGDSYREMENLIGSLKGADRLTGDAQDNLLSGLGGNDYLVGQDGADQLIGGLGRDLLTGGAGNDQFLFRSLAERGDRIVDFSTDLATADTLVISARGFGGLRAGDLAASQFHISARGLAHDSTDRFIYRPSDHTLWFDRDGTGRKYAPLLITSFVGAVALSFDDFSILS